jgi:hypothetical protein
MMRDQSETVSSHRTITPSPSPQAPPAEVATAMFSLPLLAQLRFDSAKRRSAV